MTAKKESRLQKILIPEIRKKLPALHNDPLEELENFLKENYFNLQYQVQPHIAPINFGVGHLWCLAVDHPEQLLPPCIHRAPTEKDGE